MKKIIVIAALFLGSTADAQNIGDVVYLKSGGPPLTITEVLADGLIGVKWLAGTTMFAATLPFATVVTDDPAPSIAKASAAVAARDNPPASSPAVPVGP